VHIRVRGRARTDACPETLPGETRGKEPGMEPSADTNVTHPVIDQGFRRWYQSCPCCLSESYPEVKSLLDREAPAKRTSDDAPREG
jgi:hypothetical protein